MRALSDGYALRPGTSDDAAGLEALARHAFDVGEAAAIRHLLTGEGYGPGRWTVVTDAEDEIVSCSVLLRHRFRYGSVDVPAGQIEYVATRKAHRQRGLIRAQFELLHQWAAEDGALLMFITGIPFVYRRLGYGYGLTYHEELRLVSRPKAPAGWSVERATADDAPALAELHDAALARADLALTCPPEGWPWLIAGAPTWKEELLVARRDGVIDGYARFQPNEKEDYAAVEGLATSIGAAEALAAACVERAGTLPVWMVDRPGNAWGAMARAHAIGEPGRFHGVYARVPDPVAFLDHVRPELSARLARSALANETGQLDISLYDAGVTLTYDRGEVTGVTATAEPALDPLDDERTGVPWDQFPALVLGRFGAVELELRVDDVGFGHDRPMMAVLFPPMTSDISAPI